VPLFTAHCYRNPVGKQTFRAYQAGEVRSAAEVAGGLIGFLEGDDHREAIERGDQAAAKASDPNPFFLPDRKAEPAAPITAVLRRMGNIKPESRKALEAELADETFGLSHKDITKRVLEHVRKRDNWHHLAKQPPIPSDEARVREALGPYRYQLAEGEFERLSRQWARHMGILPQHQPGFPR
jgi:hypothetical protein